MLDYTKSEARPPTPPSPLYACDLEPDMPHQFQRLSEPLVADKVSVASVSYEMKSPLAQDDEERERKPKYGPTDLRSDSFPSLVRRITDQDADVH